MNFLSSKAEHLATYLREAISQGTLSSPLPSLREWSGSLSVSTTTLQTALQILKQEGLVGSRPRSGYYLIEDPVRKRAKAPSVVRWIWHDPKHQGLPPPPELQSNLGQKLASQGISLHVERCDTGRIQAIRRAGTRLNELLIFSSLSLEQERLFTPLRNVLLLGLPHPDSTLPYISSDVFPAFRHAAYKLYREGCERIDLLHIVGRRLPESFERMEKIFRAIREEGPQPISGTVHWLPSDSIEQIKSIQKMIPQLTSRHGIIINAPLSPALVIMVLGYFGVRVPKQVSLLPVNILAEQMNVFPPLPYYPYPTEKICTSISRAAGHYFQTGQLPELQQRIALTLVEPSEEHWDPILR